MVCQAPSDQAVTGPALKWCRFTHEIVSMLLDLSSSFRIKQWVSVAQTQVKLKITGEFPWESWVDALTAN